MAAQQSDMEDILSSIRSSLAEQSAKVNGGADVTVAQNTAVDLAADDVLELTEAEMVSAGADNSSKDGVVAGDDDLIDIHAFAKTGQAKPLVEAEQGQAAVNPAVNEAVSAMPAQEESKKMVEPVAIAAASVASAAPAGDKAADEFDRLLAEISTEQKQQVAVAEEQKKALMEEPALGAEEVAAEVSSVAPMSETAPVAAVEQVAAPVYEMKALSDGALPQVALPVEVLAMALRPMVEGWLKDNLPAVVERLVREEIGKLNQG
ncbi:MAG: DUF2497 domain-containing protein [Proteobacteria bacterium]|nr:DUF2497 domain-containing protein [Pseudomonadota bacterium]NBX86883.1 DUF2497 domain-containing protein [Pseudomonadota bacterium]